MIKIKEIKILEPKRNDSGCHSVELRILPETGQTELLKNFFKTTRPELSDLYSEKDLDKFFVQYNVYESEENINILVEALLEKNAGKFLMLQGSEFKNFSNICCELLQWFDISFTKIWKT